MHLPRVHAATLLGLVTSPSSTIATEDAVSVYTGHDDSVCQKPSTVTIEEGGCVETDLFNCTAFGVGAGTTYYGQKICSDTRDGYVEAAFGSSPLFMVEYYEDINCNKLTKSSAYLADGACHYFTLGTMKVWTAEDNSMAALTVSGSCDSDDWSVFMGLNVSVNTGACIPHDEYLWKAVKYVLMGDLPSPVPSTSDNTVIVWTGNDDPSCEKPSTATIHEGGCSRSDRFECTQYDHVGGHGNVTYYGRETCSTSQEDYLKSAFGDSAVFMIEYYEDANCNKLASSTVYRADGECHYFTLGLMKIWVAGDNSMAALLTSSYCESNDWHVAMGLNVSVNTGACIHQDEYSSKAVKYVLFGNPASGISTTPATRDYGRSIWSIRDESLCTRKYGDSNACRASKLAEVDQGGALRLLDLSSQLLHLYSDKVRSALPEFLLQYLLPTNLQLFDMWKAACIGIYMYDPARPQASEDCRCVHEQLIRGISTARGIQRMIGRYELDFEGCNLLVKRAQMLYQETRSVLTDLCDRDLSASFFQQRRAYLDGILC